MPILCLYRVPSAPISFSGAFLLCGIYAGVGASRYCNKYNTQIAPSFYSVDALLYCRFRINSLFVNALSRKYDPPITKNAPYRGALSFLRSFRPVNERYRQALQALPSAKISLPQALSRRLASRPLYRRARVCLPLCSVRTRTLP